jgi:hypothetical protein
MFHPHPNPLRHPEGTRYLSSDTKVWEKDGEKEASSMTPNAKPLQLNVQGGLSIPIAFIIINVFLMKFLTPPCI